eukprot:6929478-Prymnesium_polylepis.1
MMRHSAGRGRSSMWVRSTRAGAAAVAGVAAADGATASASWVVTPAGSLPLPSPSSLPAGSSER